MSEVWSYDLDGVLAAVEPNLPPALQQKWGKLTGPQRKARDEYYLLAFHAARPLYQPPQATFDVVTARRDHPACRAVTEQWLHQHFRGRVRHLAMLNEGRRVDVVVPYKGRHLQAWGTTDYLEDNREIVRGLHRALPGVRIWLYAGGQLVPPPYGRRAGRPGGA